MTPNPQPAMTDERLRELEWQASKPCMFSSDEINELLDEHYRLREERDKLQAIVDKLPTTADGVPITPGMNLFYKNGELAGVSTGKTVTVISADNDDWDDPHELSREMIYSSRDAALAAAPGTGKEQP